MNIGKKGLEESFFQEKNIQRWFVKKTFINQEHFEANEGNFTKLDEQMLCQTVTSHPNNDVNIWHNVQK